MAVLEKIRGMGIFISVIIGLALLSFIIDPSTLQTAMSVFSSKYDVGRMNRKSISYQNYVQKVDYYSNIHQITSGSSSLDDQSVEMVQQRAWQDLLDELVIFPAIRKAGITLGNEELFDLTQGREISIALQQEPIFLDEAGIFSRSKLIEFVQMTGFDPSGMTARYWEYLESNIFQAQMYIKYFSLLEKSNILSNIELRRSIEENNTTSDVSFMVKLASFSSDTSITVSSQEIRDYYEKNKAQFEQVAGRDIDYVQFSISPSLADIDRTQKEFERYYEEFGTTDNVRAFLARNSERAFDPFYYKAGELFSISPVLDSFAFKAGLSDVLPVTNEGETFFSARLLSVKPLPDSAFVQHILIGATQMERADSLVDVIRRGGNFDALATQFSLLPPGVPERPSELGWITSQMYGGVLDSCLTAPLNTPFRVSSQYGIHILKVTQRTKPVKKVQIAVYERSAVAGKETFQFFYNQANELAVKSNNKGALFNQIANENSWPVFPAYGILEGAKTVANIPNSREISRWAYDAKVGEVSPIISIDNKYFVVVTLTAVQDKGFAPLSAKRFEIEAELRREKEVKKMAQNLIPLMAQAADIEELAELAGATVSRQTGLSFGSFGMQQFEPKLIGAVAGAREGILSGPVEGMMGAYAFIVDERQTGEFFSIDDAKRQQYQMSSQQNQMALYALSKGANVEDNRAKFF